jgi:hypothetical protein
MKYKIYITYKYYEYYEVEASSYAEVIEKADDFINNCSFNYDDVDVEVESMDD